MRVHSVIRVTFRLSVAALCLVAMLIAGFAAMVLALAGVPSYAAAAFAIALLLAWGTVRFAALNRPIAP